jgi:hypothetical protein
MRLVTCFTLIFLSFAINAVENQNQPCNDTDTFFPFKAGREAEQSQHHIEAFDIYCQLAFRGDYRAQFKLATYYHNGIDNYIAVDQQFAYFWAKLANLKIESRKKSLFVAQLKEKLTDKQFLQAEKRFLTLASKVPTGSRIDQKYKPIDLAKLLKKRKKQRKQEYTGSRIKRDKMPDFLKAIFL